MHRQSGSALVEFVVVVVVLTPIMFGIPMIGKMIDLKQTTVQASRYSAWETTVYPNATAPIQNLDQRFFSDASTPIGTEAEGPNSLWGPDSGGATNADDQAASGEALASYSADTAVIVSLGATMDSSTPVYDMGQSNGAVARKGPAFYVGEAVDVLGVISKYSGGDWHTNKMNTDGFIRGEASVQMEGNGWLDPQTITQGTVIMNDNWSVADAKAGRSRVRSLVPAGVLDEFGDVIGLMGLVPGMKELRYFGDDHGRGVFGYVDMEPLPPSEDLGHRPLKAYDEGVE